MRSHPLHRCTSGYRTLCIKPEYQKGKETTFERRSIRTSGFTAPLLSAGEYLRRLFALRCRRNEIALEACRALFTADQRAQPSVCPRGANYDSLVSICQQGYFVLAFVGSRGTATFIEAGPESSRIKLICRLVMHLELYSRASPRVSLRSVALLSSKHRDLLFDAQLHAPTRKRSFSSWQVSEGARTGVRKLKD